MTYCSFPAHADINKSFYILTSFSIKTVILSKTKPRQQYNTHLFSSHPLTTCGLHLASVQWLTPKVNKQTVHSFYSLFPSSIINMYSIYLCDNIILICICWMFLPLHAFIIYTKVMSGFCGAGNRIGHLYCKNEFLHRKFSSYKTAFGTNQLDKYRFHCAFKSEMCE